MSGTVRGERGSAGAIEPLTTHRKAARQPHRPRLEDLESRQLLTAALQAIAPITVPQFQGYQVPLNYAGGGTTQQTYTVMSSNPDVPATVAAQGPFLTFTVQHTAADATDISFNGSITYQLFQDLTPRTVAMIEQFVDSGYYIGKDITHVVPDFVFQGGAPNPNGTGNSGGTGGPVRGRVRPAARLHRHRPARDGQYRDLDTNDVQFFNTLGLTPSLSYKHTIFGQLVAGQDIAADIAQVETKQNPVLNNEKSLPINPITITAAALRTRTPMA